jgi:hypothetical protein
MDADDIVYETQHQRDAGLYVRIVLWRESKYMKVVFEDTEDMLDDIVELHVA